MIGFILILGVLVIFFGILIHLVYKYVFRRGKYRGLTIVEGLIILLGSIPGLAGCAVGWAGFGFPLPLIIGLPLHLLFLGNENCAWTQVLILSDPELTKELISFPVVWIVVNILLLGCIYLLNKPVAPEKSQ